MDMIPDREGVDPRDENEEGIVIVQGPDGQPIELTRAQVDELREMARREAEERAARLNQLGIALSDMRKTAIEGRRNAGIDDKWDAAQNAYEGIDDAQIPTERKNWSTKPPGQGGVAKDGQTRSTVFLNITAPYVDSGAAKISDMLFPTDDKCWALEATPLADESDQMAGAAAANPQAGAQNAEAAADSVKRAEKRIEDWLTESMFHEAARTVIDDAARLGTGVLGGPFPKKKARTQFTPAPDGVGMLIRRTEEIKPVSRRVRPQDFYPDPACGENIQSGSFVFEREDLTAKVLSDLRGQPGYLEDQILACLDEGPVDALSDARASDRSRDPDAKKKTFERWIFHGVLTREELEIAGCECEDEDEQGYGEASDEERAKQMIPVMVHMVNHRVIKAALLPLDHAGYPYDVMVWKPVDGCWAGDGVGHAIDVPQRMINAATRNLMDNAGEGGGAQLVINRGLIRPADGVWKRSPRKTWYTNDDIDTKEFDASKALTYVAPPMLQGDLLAIVMFALRMAEDVTGLPMILQGHQGKAPDTVGVTQLLNNNFGVVLRRIAKLFDTRITEPHIGRYYDWLMLYGPDPSEKAEASVDTRGSSVLAERAVHDATIQQMGQIVLNPAFGVDPKLWFEEFARGKRINPKRLQYTPEKLRQMAEQQAQQPPDPRIAAAQIHAQDSERDRQHDAQERDRDRNLELILADMERQMKEEAMGGNRAISLDRMRAMLAQATINSRTKTGLFGAERALKLATGQGI